MEFQCIFLALKVDEEGEEERTQELFITQRFILYLYNDVFFGKRGR